MKRAVSYALRTKDEAARRYAVHRARELGHTDLLPTNWGIAVPAPAYAQQSLDSVFEQKAEESGISVVKLKTVYFRGVEEYYSSNLDTGTPTMWGLARVQRFINCVTAGTPLSSDDDLVETASHVCAENGIEIAVDAAAICADVVYSSGANVAKMFHPGEVHAIQLEDDVLTVDGTLDDQWWSYSLNTLSGDHKLRIE